MEAGERRARTGRPWALPLVALPVVTWTVLALGLPTPLKGAIEQRASAALGRPVLIHGRLRVVLLPWGIDVAANDVQVANPAWARDRDLLRVASVTAHRSVFDMLVGRAGFESVALTDGTIALERSADARTSWPHRPEDALFDAGRARMVSADRVTLRYRDAQAGIAARLSLTLRGAGATVYVGEAAVAGRSFAVAGDVQSAVGRPARLRLAARGGGDRLGVAAEAARPLDLPRARLLVFAAGPELARFARLAGVPLAPVGDYAVAARATRRGGVWRFTHVAGRAGHSDLAGSMSVAQRRGRPWVVARLASRAVDLRDVKLLLGVRADPPAALDGAPARLLPDATFSPAGLAAFDATLALAADRLVGLARAAGPLSLRLAMRRGVLVVSPARIAVNGGFVSSDIVVDARRLPALARYDIRLSPTSMGRLIPDWGVAAAGTTAMARGRLLLTGRGASVRETLATAHGRIALVLPAGQLRLQRATGGPLDLERLNAAMFDDEAGAAINCAAIAFTVRDGVATTDPLLIDTAAHVLSGQGSIDLRDERVDLRLAAGSKHFSLWGRPSPVTIGGTLGSPVIAPEATSWLRPATLLGLQFSVPDINALFRFVDPGDAAPAACPTS